MLPGAWCCVAALSGSRVFRSLARSRWRAATPMRLSLLAASGAIRRVQQAAKPSQVIWAL